MEVVEHGLDSLDVDTAVRLVLNLVILLFFDGLKRDHFVAPVRIVSLLLLLLLLIFSFLLLETAKRNSIEQFWVLRGFLLDFNIIIIAGCLHETRERIIGLIRRPVLVLILILRLGFFVFDILF